LRKLAILFAVLIGTSASAATPKKKLPPPVPPPAPVHSWTGWYAGVNAGASMGNAKTDFNASGTGSFVSIISAGTFSFASPGFNTRYPADFIGGGQIGYNYRFSPIWVAGLEADFQGANEQAGNAVTNNFTVSGLQTVGPGRGPFAASGSAALDYQTKIDWYGTVRLRAGYVWGNDEVMTYVTGGLAYGEVKINGTNLVSGTPVFPFSVTQGFGQSRVNTGWVVGYGAEGRVGNGNWTWKIENLYMDLGTLDANASGATGTVTVPPGFTTSTTASVTTHTHFTDTILRAGLNYQFH
jgi:outer membrane immunogenic protein